MGIAILLFLMYSSSVGIYLQNETTHHYAFLWGSLNFIIVSLIMIIVPLIICIVKKKKIDFKIGKKVCLFNSIILFIISSLLQSFFGIGIIGGIGAIFYYYINKKLFVYKKDMQNFDNKLAATKQESEDSSLNLDNLEENKLNYIKVKPKKITICILVISLLLNIFLIGGTVFFYTKQRIAQQQLEYCKKYLKDIKVDSIKTVSTVWDLKEQEYVGNVNNIEYVISKKDYNKFKKCYKKLNIKLKEQ